MRNAKRREASWGVAIALGLAIGVALGNIVWGVPIGVALAIAFGMWSTKSRDPRDDRSGGEDSTGSSRN
jgi:hypothetical protein